MTREQAIKILNTVLFFGKCDCPKGEIEECFKMAIKALEQEPTTKNCESCRYYGSHHGVCKYCYKCSLWTEQEPATTNDLAVDYISRADALDCVNWGYSFSDIYKKINDLPSVTPQEPQAFKWCTDCREYDQEKHCCHRWSKVIRNTVEEMKQEYIERDVLDKTRAEIIKYEGDCRLSVDEYPSCKQCTDNVFKTIYGIIDKYKAEQEET